MNDSSNSSERETDAVGFRAELRYIVLSCVTVGFLLWIVYNRYLPISDGWFAYFGDIMNKGKLPYRDFYFFTQPLSLFLSQVIVHLGGNLICFRYYAIAERLLLTAVVYLILRQNFSRLASFVGTTVANMGMDCYELDALFTYHYTCLLWLNLAILFLGRALDGSKSRARDLFLAGVFAGLGFFTKQSTGLILAVLFAACLILFSGGYEKLKRDLILYASGFCLACLPFICWLLYEGLMPYYLNEVYFGASSAKGGILQVFFGFFVRLFVPLYTAAALGVVALLYFLRRTGLLSLAPRGFEPSSRDRIISLIMSMLYIFAIGAPLIFADPMIFWYIDLRAYWLIAIVVRLTFYATGIASFYIIYHLLRHLWKFPPHRFSPSLTLLVFASFAIMYTVGMSYDVLDHSLVPALGLCTSWVMDFVIVRRPQFTRNVVLLLSVIFILDCATKRYAMTYRWTGWYENMLHPYVEPSEPKLRGYEISRNEDVVYERILEICKAKCAPGDTLFSFPMGPLFNYLTGLPQPTFAAAYYWDVCSDETCRLDARILLQIKPKVIIWFRIPPKDMRWEEAQFRNGNRSGYRDVVDALDQLTRSGDYEEIQSLRVSEECFPIEVWVLKSPQPENGPQLFRPSFPLE
ncbi:MAG: glycosyltransferase family 39 protein [Methylacidiphilales bacterium]|nr:glycosyltransferase family 39 protein [Candidatus Methylacidiphilales bacterium]